MGRANRGFKGDGITVQIPAACKWVSITLGEVVKGTEARIG